MIENLGSREKCLNLVLSTPSLTTPPSHHQGDCCSSSPEEAYVENDANSVSQVQLRHDVVLV